MKENTKPWLSNQLMILFPLSVKSRQFLMLKISSKSISSFQSTPSGAV
jgi:hypothetical protein